MSSNVSSDSISILEPAILRQRRSLELEGIPEETLVGRAGRGDRVAFAELVRSGAIVRVLPGTFVDERLAREERRRLDAHHRVDFGGRHELGVAVDLAVERQVRILHEVDVGAGAGS